MKFERKRDANVDNKQLSILDDNSIASNEYQGEEEDGDYNNNDIHDYSDQQNSTNAVSV
jgi:hypothetical protein